MLIELLCEQMCLWEMGFLRLSPPICTHPNLVVRKFESHCARAEYRPRVR